MLTVILIRIQVFIGWLISRAAKAEHVMMLAKTKLIIAVFLLFNLNSFSFLPLKAKNRFVAQCLKVFGYFSLNELELRRKLRKKANLKALVTVMFITEIRYFNVLINLTEE